MKRFSIFLILVSNLVLLTSCVRYIPSRSEIIKPYGADPATEYIGLDSFYLYDREQRVRLQKLIDTRIDKGNDTLSNTYRIGAGDRLKIEVKNFEEVSKEYQVLPNGKIQLPFVGPIKVAGLTEAALLNKVRNKAENYVIEPQVHVEVTDYDSQKIWILGNSVENRNENNSNSSKRAYSLKRQNYSLVELLVEIGNPRLLSSLGVIYLYPAGALYDPSLGSKTNIQLARRTKLRDVNPYCGHGQPGWANTDNPEAKSCKLYEERLAKVALREKYHPNARIQIDIEELFGGLSDAPLYVPLRPGDAIYFPPPSMVQIYGEVKERGTFPVSGGGSNNGPGGSNSIKPTLFSALAAARGLTYSADINNIEIYRELEFGKKVVLQVNFEDLTLRKTQDVRLRDGDIIWVPSKSGRFIEEHSINAINQVIGAGTNIDNNVVNRR